MNKFNIYTLNNQENLSKLIKYSFTIINDNICEQTDKTDKNYSDTHVNFNTIDIKNVDMVVNVIESFDTNVNTIKYKDCFIFQISYKTFTNIDKSENFLNNRYIKEFEIISSLPKFSQYIIILDQANLESNSDFDYDSEIKYIKDYLGIENIKVIPVNITKALDYLSLIYESIESVNVNCIDMVLKEEYGKQIYKKLDTLEKKQKQIQILLDKEDTSTEWIKLTGIENFVDIIDSDVVSKYTDTIISHALIELVYTKSKINEINLTEYFVMDSKIICEIINLLSDITNIVNNDCKLDNDIILIMDNIRNYIEQYQIINGMSETNINMYLDSINIFLNILSSQTYSLLYLHSTNTTILNKKNELIKLKLLLTFDEKLFNELLSSKLIDMEFFKDCIGCCLDNNLNNFPTLIKFSSIFTQDYGEIIVREFVNKQFTNTNTNNLSDLNVDIQIDNFIESIGIFLSIYNKTNIFPDSILLAQLIYKITLVLVLGLGEFVSSHNLLTVHLFENYIRPLNFKQFSNDKYLFLQNVYYNYKLTVENNICNDVGKKKYVNDDIFLLINTKFKKIIYMLAKSIGIDIGINIGIDIGIDIGTIDTTADTTDTTDTTDILSNTDIGNIKIKTIKAVVEKKRIYLEEDEEENEEEDEEDEDEEDEEDEEESESESDLDEQLIKSDQVEKIYEFIKKSVSGKNLCQPTLRNISEIYWNKMKSYSKSIELYQLDVHKKTFTKFYKEIKKKQIQK